MELTVDHSKKLVEIWLTKADERDQTLQGRLPGIYKEYKCQGYLTAVFHSGAEDLADATSHLLCYNRTHTA